MGKTRNAAYGRPHNKRHTVFQQILNYRTYPKYLVENHPVCDILSITNLLLGIDLGLFLYFQVNRSLYFFLLCSYSYCPPMLPSYRTTSTIRRVAYAGF